MRTIQMTIDEPLLQEVDQASQSQQTTRSEFIREALKLALKQYRIAQLERRHEAGYAAQPQSNAEIAEWEVEQAWGNP
jgi:metal-responsive CopG/Arc/MetJ family transcriptional regulator